MKNLYLLIIIFQVGILYACKKDWLEVKSDKQQAIPTTLKDFQAILNNEALNVEFSSTLAELASDGHYTSEAAWNSTTNILNRNAYIWSNTRPYPITSWTYAYNRIFSTNVVLDAIKSYKSSTQTEQDILNNIKGQALFHRADAFYRTAQIWAPPYNSSSANEDLGVPLRLEADVSIPSVRSNIQQTYDLILNDLMESVKLLSSDFISKTRPTKHSAYGLLARIYLSMREYTKAGDYADSCLKISNSLLDYNELSTSANFIGNVNNNPEVFFYMYYFSTNFLTTACLIDSSLYNTYDENDLRKVIFFRRNTNGTISFKGNYNSSSSSLFCGLSNDELYLIRAESHARSGNVALAMKDLNDLLRTRWKKINGVTTYTDQTPTNADDALKKILTERKKELLMRGLRWTDLRRLNFEDAFKKTLSRAIGGNTYTLEPGSFRYTFPIPDQVISRSTMPQNPGW